jgi:phosphatidylglycerophosphatase A
MLPRFPGTWGTTGAAGIFACALLVPVPAEHLFWATAAAALAVSVVSVPLGTMAQKAFGSKDPRQFVLDEVAGFFVSLSFQVHYSVGAGFVAFLAFRALDIFKPWPIRRVESLRGGWGILMDDILAGVAANLIVRLTCFLFPSI